MFTDIGFTRLKSSTSCVCVNQTVSSSNRTSMRDCQSPRCRKRSLRQLVLVGAENFKAIYINKYGHLTRCVQKMLYTADTFTDKFMS